MIHHDLQHSGRTVTRGPSTADVKWNFSINDAGSSSPAIAADGTIYVGSNDRKLYALKPDGTRCPASNFPFNAETLRTQRR